MNRAFVFGLLAILGSAGLPAQTAVGVAGMETLDGTAKPSDSAAPAARSCPVSMRATQGSGGALLAARKAPSISGPAQHIHLILSNAKDREVARATVRVRGTSNKNRLMPTSQAAGSGPDAVQILHAVFQPESGKEVAADLDLPGFTSVSSVELESIAYKDGSTWRLGGPLACRVAPDGLMLIAAH